MELQQLGAALETVAHRVHFVSFPEYRELIVSRRKLERVQGRAECLHDIESDELFVVAQDAAANGLMESEQAFAISQ